MKHLTLRHKVLQILGRIEALRRKNKPRGVDERGYDVKEEKASLFVLVHFYAFVFMNAYLVMYLCLRFHACVCLSISLCDRLETLGDEMEKPQADILHLSATQVAPLSSPNAAVPARPPPRPTALHLHHIAHFT